MADAVLAGDPWWRTAVGYEVYVRSFADASGDGVGDLAGVTARLDHIADLGADVVWLTPFYPSPMADFGYDVSDYCEVDPLFGTLADFDTLTSEAHARRLRVVVDLVPNHCSDQHPWFRSAVADPSGPHRDYFIWRDPAPDGGPPNNWIGYFGGSAWTLEPRSGQYYLHLFLPEQPDLNWRNDAVRAEFDDILRFWLERGVDGFRIDVAQALIKDADLRDNPRLGPWDPDALRTDQWRAFDHRHDIVQPETLEIFVRWREVVAPYDGLLVGETHVLDPDQFAGLLPGDGLHLGFWFKPMFLDWNATQVRAALREPMEAVNDPTMIGWVASSHDEVRPPTRFGGGAVGRRRALVFSTLLFCLPGVPFLYQGEELGLVEGVVPEDRKADPVGADVALSRDGCRTPMPWAPGPAFGFSSTARTWLPDGGRTDADTVMAQRADPDSWLHQYRSLVALRRTHPELLDAPVEWLDHTAPDVVSFRRGPLVVVANIGSEGVALGHAGTVRYSTTTTTAGAVVAVTDVLAPDEALVIDASSAAVG